MQRKTNPPFIGLTSQDWVPLNLHPCPLIRVFQYWEWLCTPNGLYCSPGHRDDKDLDRYFAEAKQAGKTIIPAIHRMPAWFSADTSAKDWQEYPMANPGTNPANPLSYSKYSNFLFNFAARYGSTKHPDASLRVDQTPRYPNAPVNMKKSGLGLLQYLQPENEPNREWKDKKGQYTPEDFAAFMSAAYDGHEGQLGPLCGIKAADPNMKVVLPSIAVADTEYFEKAVRWWHENRNDQKIPADILAFNYYANENPRNMTRAVSPEEGGIYEIGLKLAAIGKKYQKPVWVTEFGYDTVAGSSTQVAPDLGNGREWTQSDWIIRTYLLLLAAGVDAAFCYNSIDDWGAYGGGLYQSSGVMYGEAEQLPSQKRFGKKRAWFEIDFLAKGLKDKHVFKFEVLANGKTFRVTVSDMLGKRRYFLWEPGQNETPIYGSYKWGKQNENKQQTENE